MQQDSKGWTISWFLQMRRHTKIYLLYLNITHLYYQVFLCSLTLSRLSQCCPVSLNLYQHCHGWRFDHLTTCICSTLKHFGKDVPPNGIDVLHRADKSNGLGDSQPKIPGFNIQCL